MSTTGSPPILPLVEARDLATCGGKALNLGRLLRAELPVPGGFVLTTTAFRLWRNAGSGAIPAELQADLLQHYAWLGRPTVAVRSSATAEDLAEASMAGQYETFLNISGDQPLLEAVRHCWLSLDSERTRAYLARHGIPLDSVAMAVVVQLQVPADKAGVLFTANPRTGLEDEMVIEASWGLGEAVVSGRVQPDTLILSASDGSLRSARIGQKSSLLAPGGDWTDTPPSRQAVLCLDSSEVHQLWKLGRAVARTFGSPQDLEWAISKGTLFLLQSRAITTLDEAPARLLHTLKRDLHERVQAGAGGWALHNLAESVPLPTPLTWSVLRRFMSGSGGFGQLYRRIGFQPSPVVAEAGMLDLLAGRIYMDLARAPEFFFPDFPFSYDEDLLARQPEKAQEPPTLPKGDPAALQRAKLQLEQVGRTLANLAPTALDRFQNEIVPAFRAWTDEQLQRDLTALSAPDLTQLWQDAETRILHDFAPESLLPGLLAAHFLQELEALLRPHLEPVQLAAALAPFRASTEEDLTFQATAEMAAVARGELSESDWMDRFGHRGPLELELASPRWRENPDLFRQMASGLRHAPDPRQRHHARREDLIARRQQTLADLPRKLRQPAAQLAAKIDRHLPFRENGKHELLRGYAVLRALALETGRRLGIADDIFFLEREELLQALQHGLYPPEAIRLRRARHKAAAKLDLPPLIARKAVENLGSTPAPDPGARAWQGFAISPGRAEGPVRVAFQPADIPPEESGFILVCPTTDPSWTPLFARAAGVVLSCGGTLSHGAVVAREMGVPAAVLTDATRLLTDGTIIRVDGDTGQITVAHPEADAKEPDAASAPPADEIPPVTPAERSGWKWAWIATGIWAVYFIFAFGVSPRLFQAPANSIFDTIFLPAWRMAGPVAMVALVAAAIAVATLVLQRLVTDNRRLLAVRDAVNALRKRAQNLSPEDPQRTAMLTLAGRNQRRILFAALVPLAFLLGPMVMSLNWLANRVEPALWNAAPGATVQVTAEIDGDFTGPVELKALPPLELAASSPTSRTLPPIRRTLENLRARWNQETPLDAFPWELQAAALQTREALLADLDAFLRQPLAPRPVAWIVHSSPDQPGRFPIDLIAIGHPPVRTFAVLGNGQAPEWKEDAGDGRGPQQFLELRNGHPIRSVRVTYQQPLVKGGPAFWQPFASLGWNWDPGWLLTYLILYLPIFLILKKLLRIP